MIRKAFLCAALIWGLSAEAAVTGYFSSTPDCAGASGVGYAPAGPYFQVSLCMSTDFESVCGATFQLQAANAAESGKFRVINRDLGGPYADPNAPFVDYPVPITFPAQLVDFGGTVNSGNPPQPGTNQRLATFTLEALSTATNPTYQIGLSAVSNVAIDGVNCFETPHDQPIGAVLTLSRNDLNTDPPRLTNISTRGQVQTGSDVMIAGFVVSGANPKNVLIRALGPTLTSFGVPGALADPQIQLVRLSDNQTIATNDNWQSAGNASVIQASGLAPSNPLEPAVHMQLQPGAYTAIISGVNNGTGVALVEAYEMDQPGTPFINISTRGKVLTGSDVMIGGFVVQGTGSQTVLIRAIGPSLANFGVQGALSNPTMSLVRISDNSTIASNDDWQTNANAAAITATGNAPTSPLESALLVTLQPGAYTAVVSGTNGATGTALIEVYKVGP